MTGEGTEQQSAIVLAPASTGAPAGRGGPLGGSQSCLFWPRREGAPRHGRRRSGCCARRACCAGNASALRPGRLPCSRRLQAGTHPVIALPEPGPTVTVVLVFCHPHNIPEGAALPQGECSYACS